MTFAQGMGMLAMGLIALGIGSIVFLSIVKKFNLGGKDDSSQVKFFHNV
mgnify:CR=1 FL=1